MSLRSGTFDPLKKSTTLRCQYLVIGSGAGGSIAAHELAANGKDVLLIEEGRLLESSEFSSSVGLQTRLLYRRGGVSPFFGKPTIAFAEGCCVGGGTVINGGLLWRTPEFVLEEWQKGLGVPDMEARYWDRHFDRVEKNLEVSRSYPLEGNQDSALVTEAAQALRWKCVPVPRALRNCTNQNLCGSGCPTDAKKSTLLNYLPRALNHGATLLADCKARRMYLANRKVNKVQCLYVREGKKHTITIKPDWVILSAGAVQTPHLLRSSGIVRHVGTAMNFHMNLKVVALFNDRIDAENGTIFTHQIQEFEKEGILIMPSNWKKHYVAATLGHFGTDVIKEIMEKFDYGGMFVAQVRAKSTARIFSSFREEPLVISKFDPQDLVTIRKALKRAGELLFKAGATAIYLPIKHSPSFTRFDQLESYVDAVSRSQLDIISVHAMSSCKMLPQNRGGVVNRAGNLHGLKNVLAADASILPSNIGESPQGTIMALAHDVMERHLEETGRVP